MSGQANEADQEVQSKIYGELEEFEKNLAAARKRTRDADYLDRKLVISDSTEFERHFDNLSEAIARLLPYHTFYVDEIKPNRVQEDPGQTLERRKRIKNIEDSIMSISTSCPSFIFNACKYGFIRLVHSSILMDLERNKKELAQLQALELAWKYPMEGSSSFPGEKTMVGGCSPVIPGPTLNAPSHLGTGQFDHSSELLYRNPIPKAQYGGGQASSAIGNYNMSKHYFDAGDMILGLDKEKDLLPGNSHISQTPGGLDNAYLSKMNITTGKNMDPYPVQPDLLKNERLPNMGGS